MTRNLYWAGGLAALAALLPSAGAVAAVVVITVKGAIPPGTIDVAGFFGPAGGSLDGDLFTATYKLDTATLGALHIDTATEKAVYGGDAYPAPTPSLGTTLNINGFTVHIAGQQVGSADAQIFNGESRQIQVSSDASGSGASAVELSLTTDVFASLGSLPLAVDQAFGPAPVNGESYGNFFYLNGGTGVFESFMLAPSTIQEVFALPEPGAWTLMLMGLGAIGGAARMRRARAAA